MIKQLPLIGLLWCLSLSLSAQTLHALLIGIDNYPSGSGWSSTGALQDTTMLLPVLREKGFTRPHIHTVVERAATKEGIAAAFTKLSQTLQARDHVIVIISAHGCQITDDNGDEFDGYDEAIVTVDADPNKFLRDDELGLMLKNISTKIGLQGHLVVALDACHSGTGTRTSSQDHRGRSTPFGPPAAPLGTQPESHYSLESNVDNIFAIFACQPNQVNYTYAIGAKKCGSLSYALTRALKQSNPGETCQTFADRISTEMAKIDRNGSNQMPQWEGSPDRVLLGGQHLKSPSYFGVTPYKNDLVYVHTGTAQQIDSGSAFVFYPIGLQDTSRQKPLTTGTIIKPGLVSSLVKLDQTIGTYTGALKAYVKHQVVRIQLQISLDALQDAGLKSAIRKGLRGQDKVVEVATGKNHDLALLAEQGWLKIYTTAHKRTSDSILLSDSAYVNHLFNEVFHKHFRSKYLKSLHFENDFDQLKLEVFRVKTRWERGKIVVVDRVSLGSTTGYGQQLAVKVGDTIAIRITNEGQTPIYFNLLDFQPDGVINSMVPSYKTNRPAQDYLLSTNSVWNSESSDLLWDIKPPLGTETLVLIATQNPIDLRNALYNNNTRSPQNPPNALERLFEEIKSTTRTAQSDVKTGRISTTGVTFEIQPKK